MAPGRKQKHAKTVKPASTYVHPSLSASNASSASTKQDELSVSERIEYLRRVQTPHLSTQDRENQDLATLPRIPERIRDAPRVAGPKPPRSWTDGSLNFKHGSSSGYAYERRPPKLDYFPGAEFPPVTSLLHQAMKALSVNFDWHLEYDHFYMSTLPVSQKSLLLRYIARYGPYEGIEVDELRFLFSSQHELDAISASLGSPLQLETSGSEELDCLDLGGSIGRKGRLKQLDKYWTTKTEAVESTPEQWDSTAGSLPTGTPKPGIHSPLRFPSLVKLSLACPGRNTSWPDLLHFSRHLGALTHLSLAHWPIPRTSNTIFNKESSIGTSNTAFRTSLTASADLDEAVDALRQLSRNTPSLRYLSLAACETWYRALRHVSTLSGAHPQPRSARRIVREFGDESSRHSQSGGDGGGAVTQRFVDFSGPWRHVAHLDLSQATLPAGVDSARLSALHRARGGPSASPAARGAGESYPVELQGADAAQLAELAWQRHVNLRRMTARSPGGDLIGPEQYRIMAPTASVAEQMKQRERMRAWCERECDALDVAWFVKAVRLMGGGRGKGKGIEVAHGWGKEELLDVGYDEAELFEAGF